MRFKYSHKAEEPKATPGERIISHLIGNYGKIRYRTWMFRKEANEGNLDLQDLYRICLGHVSPVTSPLALISHTRGSGGPLLSHLFDGHPELHCHPHELLIGYPETYIWPRIDLRDHPERWFAVLFEDIVTKYSREGYKENQETFPFIFIPSLQREFFLNYLRSLQVITLRDVFDAYMTSYFGAWLNNQNYIGQKKFVAALTLSLAMIKDNTESFFEVYPEGRIISIVRDPRNWFPSAKVHWPESYGDVERASSQWNESAQATLWNKERYGERVCIVNFEDLVSKTEPCMRYLADFLKIRFDDILLVPTFNKHPIQTNTSFEVKQYGTVNSTLHSYKTLSQEELEVIYSRTNEFYREIMSVAIHFS